MSGWFFKKKTEDTEKLWNEAVSRMESGDFKKAIEKFSDFIKLEPKKIGPYLMRGQAYMKSKKLNEAIRDFSKALELNPDKADVYYLRGQAYSSHGEPEKAVEDFKLTLEKTPLRPGLVNIYSVHLSLGVELFKLARYKEAEMHLEEVLAISPNNQTAQTTIEQVRQRLGSMEKKKISNNSDKLESLIHTAEHNFFQREEAIKALGETGDKRAIAPLVEILKSEFQSRTRQIAADSLEKLGWEPVDDMDKAYLLIARGRWKQLAELGVEYLILALKWPQNERDVMPYFVEVGEAATGFLAQALQRKEFSRGAIATILGRLGDKRATAPLAQILTDQDAAYDLKDKAAQALNKLDFEPRNDTEKAYLLVAAKRWDEAAELGKPAVEPLIQVLRRLGWPEAREALAKIGKPAVEPLIQALGDNASWARFSAATALGKIGDERAVQPLTQILKTETNQEIKEAIEQALETIKTKPIPRDSWKVLEERPKEAAVAATEAGEVYQITEYGRIVDTGQTYTSTFGFGHTNEDDRIRQLWPERAEAIIERGNHRFWSKVGWQPKVGMVGRILALYKHAVSGCPIYIMEFRVGEDRVYLPIGTSGVELVEGAT